jgi:hypothetical protein
VRILLFFALTLFLWAQDTSNALVKAVITPSGGVQRLTVNITGAIGPNDDLGVWMPTRKAQVVLVTPAGKRISESTANADGVDWRQSAQAVDSADADAPVSISIRFPAQPGPGNFVFEITPVELERPVEVTAAFRPEVKAVSNAPAAPPNILMLGPVNASPAGAIDFTIHSDEPESTVDVLVNDPNAKVRIVLPGNLTVNQLNATGMGMRWRVTEDPTTLDAPGGMLSLSGFYIPGPGWHHVLTMQRASRGPYKVIVESDKGAEFRAAFLPVGRLIETAFDSVDRLAKPRDAEVKFSARPLPGAIHAGDNVLLQVQFDGEPVSRPLQFEAEFEYRNGNAPPHVRRMPLTMGWALDDTFRTYFQPEREGELTIKLTAAGRTITGLPFSAKADVPTVRVKPVTARLMGIWEQSVDTDGDGLFDRMDIHAELEMLKAASMEMGIALTTRGRQATKGTVQKEMPVGRQRVTLSFSAAQVLALPGDGPFIIEDIQMKLKLADGGVDDVQTAGYRIGTQAYRRVQWDATKK